uniref:Uncharacterized protein n=1 Tax=Ditylenchus dipsaci TaxID=166011 RepID=A0A915CTS8_9BILA
MDHYQIHSGPGARGQNYRISARKTQACTENFTPLPTQSKARLKPCILCHRDHWRQNAAPTANSTPGLPGEKSCSDAPIA